MILLLLASLSYADPIDPCWDAAMDVAPVAQSRAVPIDAVLRAHSNPNCPSSAHLELTGGDAPQSSDGTVGDGGWTHFSDVQLQANTSYIAVFSNEAGAETTVEFTTTDQASEAPQPPTVTFDSLEAIQQASNDVDLNHYMTAIISDASGAATVLFTRGSIEVQASAADGRAQAVLTANVPAPEDVQCLQVVTLSPSLERSAPTDACPDADEVEYFPIRRCSTVPGSASLAFLLLPLLLRRRRR